MTRVKKVYAVKGPARFSVNNLENELDKRFYKILKILMIRDNKTTSFFKPQKKLPNNEHVMTKKLMKIEKNIFGGKYIGKPWLFIREVNDVFDSVINNFTNRSKMYQEAAENKEIFSCKMDEIMEEQGFCCGRSYFLVARGIHCSGKKNCIVPVDSLYYRYKEWTYCQQCFDKRVGDIIELEEDHAVNKSNFEQFYCEAAKQEEFVRCQICHRKSHEVCVLHPRYTGDPFYCKMCCDQFKIKKVAVRASKLPSSECDEFINQFMKSQQMNQHDSIVIRMLSDTVEPLVVKDKLQAVYNTPPDGKDFSFQNYTIFTFFDTGNNTDVCFFAVFFQLYGDDCPPANQRSVYISYIDSINLMPSPNRTKVYRLIILGLIKYLKVKGFEKVFLWSCPPKQHQDYIFYMKPIAMKMPTPGRLATWYTELLQLGKDLDIIDSFCGINDAAMSENWSNFDDIPLMEGDNWVTRMVEAVTKVSSEIKKLKSEVVSLVKRLKLEKLRSGSTSYQTKKAIEMSTRLEAKKKLVVDFSANLRLWELMTVQLKGFNSQYFVIQLRPEAKFQNPEIRANGLVSRSSWLYDRHVFVDFFWGLILEFSTERRAQYSTHVMLHRIFAENKICVQCVQVSEGGLTGALLCETCHRELNFKNSGVEIAHTEQQPVRDEFDLMVNPFATMIESMVISEGEDEQLPEEAHSSNKSTSDSGYSGGSPISEDFDLQNSAMSSGTSSTKPREFKSTLSSESEDETMFRGFPSTTVAYALQKDEEVILIESDRSSDTDDSRVERKVKKSPIINYQTSSQKIVDLTLSENSSYDGTSYSDNDVVDQKTPDKKLTKSYAKQTCCRTRSLFKK